MRSSASLSRLNAECLGLPRPSRFDWIRLKELRIVRPESVIDTTLQALGEIEGLRVYHQPPLEASTAGAFLPLVRQRYFFRLRFPRRRRLRYDAALRL